MLIIQLVCRGVSPLLMNRVQESVLDGLDDKSKKGAKSAAARGTPRERCEQLVYLDERGQPAIPGVNLFAGLKAAGQFVRLDGKRQVSTATKTVLPSFLTVLDNYAPIFDPNDPSKPAMWEVDKRRGVNPNGGELVCVTRPRFDRWAFAVQLLHNDDVVSMDVVRQLVDRCGSSIGMMDHRPSRGGTSGRFVVDSWNTVAASTKLEGTKPLTFSELPENARPVAAE